MYTVRIWHVANVSCGTVIVDGNLGSYSPTRQLKIPFNFLIRVKSNFWGRTYLDSSLNQKLTLGNKFNKKVNIENASKEYMSTNIDLSFPDV